MACPVELTLTDATPKTVYWGHLSTLVLDGSVMNLWADADFDTLLSVLQSETAFYRSGTGYYMESDDPFTFNQYFYFVVPDDYASFTATSGLQYGYGNVGTPFKNVVPWPGSSPAELSQNDGGLSNWPTGDAAFGFSESNGWWYWARNISGVPYRFYAFGAHFNLSRVVCDPAGIGPYPADQASVPVSRSRTSNVTSFVMTNNADWSSYCPGYLITVSGMGDPTFDIAQPGVAWDVDVLWTDFHYANTGADVGSTADVGFTVTAWQRNNFPWIVTDPISDDHLTPEFSVTLFVVP